MKEITDKLNFIKMKNFCSAKDNIKKLKRQATDSKRIFKKKKKLIKASYINIQMSLKTQQ